MKLINIILFTIILLIGCADEQDDNVKSYSNKEWIEKVALEASKIITKYSYDIKFGEPKQTPDYTSKSYFKYDTLLILRIDKGDLDNYTYLYKRGGKNELLKIIGYSHNKVVSESTYDYDINGNQIKATSYNSNGDISWKTLYKYDVGNRLMEEFHYDSTGYLWLKTDFTYDKKDNKIKELELNNKRNVPQMKTESEYKYNNKNLLNSEYSKQFGNPDGFRWILLSDAYTVYRYNKNDKLKEVIKKRPYTKHRDKHQFDSRKLYNFNDDGKVVEEFEFQTVKGEKEKILYRRVRSYNSMGEESEFKVYNGYGELVTYIKYEYDFSESKRK